VSGRGCWLLVSSHLVIRERPHSSGKNAKTRREPSACGRRKKKTHGVSRSDDRGSPVRALHRHLLAPKPPRSRHLRLPERQGKIAPTFPTGEAQKKQLEPKKRRKLHEPKRKRKLPRKFEQSRRNKNSSGNALSESTRIFACLIC
jgi:hypothetical protein